MTAATRVSPQEIMDGHRPQTHITQQNLMFYGINHHRDKGLSPKNPQEIYGAVRFGCGALFYRPWSESSFVRGVRSFRRRCKHVGGMVQDASLVGVGMRFAAKLSQFAAKYR